MRILLLSRWFPFPADNGSKIRIFNILRRLSEQHQIALVSFGDEMVSPDQAILRKYCHEIKVVPYRDFRPWGARAFRGLTSTQPRWLFDTHSEQMSATVDRVFCRFEPDLVIASQLAMAPYASRLPGVPRLLEELELARFRDAVGLGLIRGVRARLTWMKLTLYLRRLLSQFSACTVVSETERINLRSAVPDYTRVTVVPNAINLADYEGPFGPARPHTLIFAGALTYDANFDAVNYFLREIYPQVHRAVPEAVLRVTGRCDGVDLRRLPSLPGVQYTGYLTDVRPQIAESWVSVVPLRHGGGTRFKILESMALGTPVVTTPKGIEGLDAVHGQHALIAHDPNAFAEEVVKVLRSPAERDRLSSQGRQLVEARYDWNVVGQQLRALAEDVARGRQDQAGLHLRRARSGTESIRARVDGPVERTPELSPRNFDAPSEWITP